MKIQPEEGYPPLNLIKNRTSEMIRSKNFDAPILPIYKKHANQEITGSSEEIKGDIEFIDLTLSYRQGLCPALKGLSLVIKEGEKIGIIGKTGAGKSTLLKSLLKIVSEYQGKIKIGDQEIRNIPLLDLRRAITVIPQATNIFTDTIRRNLDPQGLKSELEICEILEDIQLLKKIKNLENGLDTEIKGEGGIFSQGEKQLLCLVRAILDKQRIVLIDEATANLDIQSDRLVQKLIQKHFKESTVLVIAHRLDTIMDCDR